MIDGKHLIKALETAGIVNDAEQVASLTIHCYPYEPVRIEVSYYAKPSLCMTFTNLSRDCE